jgi:hypothetical protein
MDQSRLLSLYVFEENRREQTILIKVGKSSKVG